MDAQHKGLRIWLPIAILLAGLSVPVVPRAVVPLLRPAEYVDSIAKILSGNVQDVFLLFGWTAAPFAILALIAVIWKLTPPRVWGFVGAAVPAMLVGYAMHVPTRGYGMNFGVAFFPFYAVLVMPIGFAAAWFVRRRLMA